MTLPEPDADGQWCELPGHPALTRILRQHIEDEQLQPGDLLLQGESGGILAGSVIRRTWRCARKTDLPVVYETCACLCHSASDRSTLVEAQR
ncbi:hypothetical protein [Streptomyces puniciscabiei]|uniref:hypothetical protein n=1 Tax=Streptomyces puniciscabiei TaxID=164348 RepID=UPI000A72DE81|nr:hypothetical protein [Streptomyces puniciscabiei]